MNEQVNEATLQASLRPQTLAEFIGHDDLCARLNVYCQAAKQRNKPLDHTLFSGPPGLGKTTLAHVLARECGVSLRTTSGPVLERPGDLAAILSSLDTDDMLFIDEIHRMPKVVEEVLYPALEDGYLDILVGSGVATRSVRVNLSPFSVVAATTRPGALSAPLRDRFGISERLELYDEQALTVIAMRTAEVLGINLLADGAEIIAARSRGTPRVVNRLVKRVADFALVAGEQAIQSDLAAEILERLDIDSRGLEALDRNVLSTIATQYSGGPVGIDAIAAALQEDRRTLEELVEPYLLSIGFLRRTPGGRTISEAGYRHLGLEPPSSNTQQTLY